MEDQAGFTLLEVLVAMVILGVSFSVLVQGFLAVADSVGSGRDYTYMSSWANSKLTEITGGVELNRHGSFDYRGKRCNWLVSTEYISSDLRRLKLEVSWPGNKGQKTYSTSRIIMQQD